ncbi:MAG: TadE/TadG family type IV pilus assembly protein [Anaerolineales bacterium]
MKTKNKSERGQSLVELAISLVVLLFLLSGVVEFGIAFFQFIQLRDAAQEGALYASLNPTDNTNIETRVRNASNSPIDLQVTTGSRAVTVAITPSDADGDGRTTCVGDGIQVSVDFYHQVFMPFIPKITGPTIHLTGSVTDTILRSTTSGCP